MGIVGKTATRVADHTDPRVNEEIWLRSLERIEKYAHRDRTAIVRRLAELDREWDIERMLGTHGAILGLAGLWLGAAYGARWRWLTGLSLASGLAHFVHGWCPPGVVLRRLGFRTEREIDEERAALIALLDS